MASFVTCNFWVVQKMYLGQCCPPELTEKLGRYQVMGISCPLWGEPSAKATPDVSYSLQSGLCRPWSFQPPRALSV